MSQSKDFKPGEDDPLHAVKAEITANIRTCLEAIILGTTYPKQLFTFQVVVVEDRSVSHSHVFPACLNACIALLNQTGIAQKEAPCFAVIIGATTSNDGRMEVDGESGFQLETKNTDRCEVLLEIVANQSDGTILHLRSLKNAHSDALFDSDLIMLDSRLEQTLRQVGEQIIAVTFSE